jgi:hypothetical protein
MPFPPTFRRIWLFSDKPVLPVSTIRIATIGRQNPTARRKMQVLLQLTESMQSCGAVLSVCSSTCRGLPRSGLTDIEKSAALELAGSHFLARFNAHGWTSAACLKTIAAKKNWLLTEFIEVAAAQFIDEIAARTNELRGYQARSKQCFVTSHTSPKGDGRGHCIRTTFLGRAD